MGFRATKTKTAAQWTAAFMLSISQADQNEYL